MTTASKQKPTAADRHRFRMAQKSRDDYANAAELGPLPKVKNPSRKARCRKSLWNWVQEYQVKVKGFKPYSDDHKRLCQQIQNSILDGGWSAVAYYRGGAKSTFGQFGVEWGILYGHIKFGVIFGFNSKDAEDILADIKTDLQNNDALLEDFPEVCYPIQAYEDKHQRAKSQTYKGQRTEGVWQTGKIVIPAIPRSKASWGIIAARKSKTRGVKHQLPNGVTARPDYFLADDVQDDETALSALTIRKQLATIRKSWAFLSGPHVPTAGTLLGTPVEADDVIDQMTDPERIENAAWETFRVPMVKSWAKRHDDLWMGTYRELRTTYSRDIPGQREIAWAAANEFYLANRKDMDFGCEVSWDHCGNSTSHSAIQHAYNMLIDVGQEAFDSECQCHPKQQQGDLLFPKATWICNKQSGLEQRIVPKDATRITTFIDQQDYLLYYLTMAWAPGFTGYVIDYGAWPDQQRRYFAYRDARYTLTTQYPGRDTEGALWAGLEDLVGMLATASYVREGGGTMSHNRIAIDANNGNRTELIRRFIERSRYRSIILPWFGRAVKAKETPISMRRMGNGCEKGTEWMMSRPAGAMVPNLYGDVWYWGKRAIDALSLPIGSKGNVSLFQTEPDVHQMLADHIRAMYADAVSANGRTVFEFSKKPGNPDEHLWDCLLGNFVLADIEGVKRPEDSPPPPRRRKRNRVRSL